MLSQKCTWKNPYHLRGQYKSTNSPESFSIFDWLQMKNQLGINFKSFLSGFLHENQLISYFLCGTFRRTLRFRNGDSLRKNVGNVWHLLLKLSLCDERQLCQRLPFEFVLAQFHSMISESIQNWMNKVWKKLWMKLIFFLIRRNIQTNPFENHRQIDEKQSNEFGSKRTHEWITFNTLRQCQWVRECVQVCEKHEEQRKRHTKKIL